MLGRTRDNGRTDLDPGGPGNARLKRVPNKRRVCRNLDVMKMTREFRAYSTARVVGQFEF